MDFVQFPKILPFGKFFPENGIFFETWENQVPLTSLVQMLINISIIAFISSSCDVPVSHVIFGVIVGISIAVAKYRILGTNAVLV